MSYGSLSSAALSPYHLGVTDVVWQIRIGYFDCRTETGCFNPDIFKEKAANPNFKMVEVKLSQGAKLGQGGILPAVKNNAALSWVRPYGPSSAYCAPLVCIRPVI